MEITLKEITIKELADGYSEDPQTSHVVGYGGKLDIRPIYQREFVYNDKQREAVIDTVFKGFPLNVMYWAARDNGTFEIIDGQQRTISICQYAKSVFSLENRYYHNLTPDEKARFENYKLTIYICKGTDSEKLSWFKTINIAGEKLSNQELRNAVYAGTWTVDAKRYFSRNGCAAYQIGKDYLKGAPIRQEFLETAIEWISENHIENYMATHQHDANASPLWQYFQSVINWVKILFPKYRKEMKGVPWGDLYNKYKSNTFNAETLETEVKKLMADDDVTNKSGIYQYILTREEKHLSVRAFSDTMKHTAYEKQKGICPVCKKHFNYEEMEGDHITPWHDGGRTIAENCQMLCKDCNRRKGGN
ncbi:MAG: DUF262 domain-containing protein [Opitutales bacterium]|nr:DUF262 domain-containing protein [Opitutales bacterium]